MIHDEQDKVLLEIVYKRPIEVQKAICIFKEQGLDVHKVKVLKINSLIAKIYTGLFFFDKNRTKQGLKNKGFKVKLKIPQSLLQKTLEDLEKYTTFRVLDSKVL